MSVNYGYEGEPADLSSTGAGAVLSQNRPIVMPESFAALDSEERDSWIAHFDYCAVINDWNAERKAPFLAVRMRGAALLQLENIPAAVQGNYDDLKAAVREKCDPQKRGSVTKQSFGRGVEKRTRNCPI